MSARPKLILLVAGVLFSPVAHASPLPIPVHSEIAPGIHLFRTEPYGDVGFDGNAVAIVSNAGVLVFDANGTPVVAREVIAQLRRITPQPVRWLVYSHWHWDHWYGAQEYVRAFPGLEIVSQEATRRLMAGPAIEFNQPGLDHDLPDHVAAVEAALAAARDSGSAPARIESLRNHAARDRAFLAQKREARHVLATVTFTDSLVIHMGEREIHVLHVDRAITPGDAFLWLPQQRIVVTGDLLVNPVTFGLFCYPAGWMRTLEWIDALGAATIVPGHGAPLYGPGLLRATLALLRREREVVRASRQHGDSEDATLAAALADPEVLRLRDAILGGDASRVGAFELYLGRWVVARMLAEEAGPLDDSIPALR